MAFLSSVRDWFSSLFTGTNSVGAPQLQHRILSSPNLWVLGAFGALLVVRNLLSEPNVLWMVSGLVALHMIRETVLEYALIRANTELHRCTGSHEMSSTLIPDWAALIWQEQARRSATPGTPATGVPGFTPSAPVVSKIAEGP